MVAPPRCCYADIQRGCLPRIGHKMPGHNALANLNVAATQKVGGNCLQFCAIGTSTPDSTVVETVGYMRGALLLNSTGTSTANTVYVNLGTVAAATWTALTVS